MDSIQIFGMRFARMVNFNLEVNRNTILNDTINCISQANPKDLMKPLKVKFIGEEGEDAGGIKKEFFMVLFQKILGPESVLLFFALSQASSYGMFVEDQESHLLWFSGLPFSDPSDDGFFRLVGQLCAMAIYNNVLVNLPFPLALYKVWIYFKDMQIGNFQLILGQKPTLEDLAELHPSTGRGLEAMLSYEEPDFEVKIELTILKGDFRRHLV